MKKFEYLLTIALQDKYLRKINLMKDVQDIKKNVENYKNYNGRK
jgi:hypothetical protein